MCFMSYEYSMADCDDRYFNPINCCSILLLLFISVSSVRGQEYKNTDLHNGTYISISNKNVRDTSYVRITFLNDTTFAFSLDDSHPPQDAKGKPMMDQFLKYNYDVFSGIAVNTRATAYCL